MNEKNPRLTLEQPAEYCIEVQGQISQGWLDYFDELQISVAGEDGWAITTLNGRVADQAALQGLLQKLYNLGLVLLTVKRKEK